MDLGKLAQQHKIYTRIHKYIGIAITECMDLGKLTQSNIILILEYISNHRENGSRKTRPAT